MNRSLQNTFIVFSLLLTGLLTMGAIRYVAYYVSAQSTASPYTAASLARPDEYLVEHQCLDKAQKGDFNCDNISNYDDFTIFQRDYKRGDSPLAPFFEWIRRPVFDSAPTTSPTNAPATTAAPTAGTSTTAPTRTPTTSTATTAPTAQPTSAPAPSNLTEHITKTIQQVEEASIKTNLEAIVDKDTTTEKDEAQTRYSGTSGNETEANYIKSFFEQQGIEVELQSFSFSGVSTKNIVARIYGTDRNSWYLATAHMDSISEKPTTAAPGADDNGSGTVTVMEMAKAIKKAAVPLNRSLEFILFSGEEEGLKGSYYYADRIPTSKKIIGVVNVDMIGNKGSKPDCVTMNYKSRSGGNLITEAIVDVNRQFSIGLDTQSNPTTETRSDHYPFWQKGIVAVFGHECEFSPVYHSTNDKTDKVSYSQLAKTAKAIAGTLVKMSHEGQGQQIYAQRLDADESILGTSTGQLAQTTENPVGGPTTPDQQNTQKASILAYVTYSTPAQLKELQTISTHFIAYIEETYVETPVFLGLFDENGVDTARKAGYNITVLDLNADLRNYAYLYHPQSGQSSKLAFLGSSTEIASRYYLLKLNPGKQYEHVGAAAQFFELPLPLNEVMPKYDTVMITLAPTQQATPILPTEQIKQKTSAPSLIPVIVISLITLLTVCLIGFFILHKKHQEF